jgi:hypothetical protein
LDPCDEESVFSSDVSKWKVEGESYPTYEKLSRWAIRGDAFSGRIALGTYGALSSFSHPSFIAGREHRVVDNSRLTYTYDFDYIRRLISLAIFGLTGAFKMWVGYYDWEHDVLVARLDEIADKWDEVVGIK